MPRSFIILFAVIALIAAGAVGGAVRLGLFRGRPDPLVVAEQRMGAGDLRGAQLELRTVLRDRPSEVGPHLRMAELAFRLGDAVAAEKELTTARGLGADPGVVLPQLGRAWLEQGHYAEVLSGLPESGASGDATAQLLVLRGSAQLGLKDVAGAGASLAAAERASPGRADAAVLGARLAIGRGDLVAAEASVDAALARDPARLDALLLKQRMLGRRDASGALAVADRAVAAAPWSADARLSRGNLLMNAGQDGRAREDVDAVLRLQPGNAFARYMGAVLLVRANRDAEASTELERLGPLAPFVPRVVYYQAMVAGRLGQAKAAEEAAVRYSRRVPGDVSGSILLAQTEIGVGRADLALAALEKIEGDARSSPQVLDLLGAAYSALGRTSEASDSFARAASLAPDNAMIAGHLGLSEARGGGLGTDAALDRLETLAAGRPAAGEVLVRAALTAGDFGRAGAALERLRADGGETETVGILTGTLAMAKLDFAGAEAAFAATVRRSPGSVNAKIDLARALVQEGWPAEAAGVLAQVLAVDKGNRAALTSYVRLQVQQKQFDPAVQALEAGRVGAPRDVGLTAMLAEVLMAKGDAPGALAVLKAAEGGERAVVLVLETAKAQLAAGDRVGAKATLEDGLKGAPGNFQYMAALVQVEAQSGGVEGALREAEALRREPSNMPGAAPLVGEVLFSAQRYGEAAEALRAEYALAPTDRLLSPLVRAYVGAGRDGEALSVARARLGVQADDPVALQAVADLELKAGHNDAAAHALEGLLATGRGDALAMNNLAWLYQKSKDGRALPMARRAYTLAPSAATADTLGWIMVQDGDAGGAVPLLQRAVAVAPGERSTQYHLAVALKESGKAEEAMRVLEPLVAGPGEFEDKGAARALLDGLRVVK